MIADFKGRCDKAKEKKNFADELNAEFLKHKELDTIIIDTFTQVDSELKGQDFMKGDEDMGSTCCFILVIPLSIFFHFSLLSKPDPSFKLCCVANLGDTRAVLNKSTYATPLTIDHKCFDPIEADRIKFPFRPSFLLFC